MADSIPVAFPAPGTESHAAHRRKGGRLVDSDKAIIDTYLLPKSHGTCRRFCCECCLIVGCMLPLLGPLLGLCVFVPYFDLLFEEGNVIQPDTPCFGDEPTICPVSFQFDYFFWNITNAEQVRQQAHCSLLCLDSSSSLTLDRNFAGLLWPSPDLCCSCSG